GDARREGRTAPERAGDAVPDRVGGALRARDDRVDGVRHAGDRHATGRRAGGDRARPQRDHRRRLPDHGRRGRGGGRARPDGARPLRAGALLARADGRRLPAGLQERALVGVGEPMVPPRAPSFAGSPLAPLDASRRAKPGFGGGCRRHDARTWGTLETWENPWLRAWGNPVVPPRAPPFPGSTPARLDASRRAHPAPAADAGAMTPERGAHDAVRAQATPLPGRVLCRSMPPPGTARLRRRMRAS